MKTNNNTCNLKSFIKNKKTMKAQLLKEEKVYSTVLDKNFTKDINNSPVWKNCIHSSDVPAGFKGHIYTVMFDGLKPVFCKGVTAVN